ncbi:protein PIH1D3 isoform X2 [Hemibagrus wyckioides]|uniref:protein PIH1D3 isoform X2 n=1 Tax=Hemibagrus wyckioides TaxID=337641 RepID=UPI00266C2219|nr:protein PIH1D3 isoform X2 [Hemibagrus wyckioides]
MVELSSLQNLQALSDLLSLPADEESDAEDCKNVNLMAKMGPGHIGACSPASRQGNNAAMKVHRTCGKNTKDIWDMEEVTEGTHSDDLEDPRPQPEYEIIMKQSVGTEDLFLGMSRNNPSSMCCESMLVRVKLPKTQASDLVLGVKERFIDLRTPNYRLALHLPHSVHNSKGTARFITGRCELEITLPMNRPLDSINLT